MQDYLLWRCMLKFLQIFRESFVNYRSKERIKSFATNLYCIFSTCCCRMTSIGTVYSVLVSLWCFVSPHGEPDAWQCLPELSPDPVRSGEEPSVLFFALLFRRECCEKTPLTAASTVAFGNKPVVASHIPTG